MGSRYGADETELKIENGALFLPPTARIGNLDDDGNVRNQERTVSIFLTSLQEDFRSDF